MNHETPLVLPGFEGASFYTWKNGSSISYDNQRHLEISFYKITGLTLQNGLKKAAPILVKLRDLWVELERPR